MEEVMINGNDVDVKLFEPWPSKQAKEMQEMFKINRNEYQNRMRAAVKKFGWFKGETGAVWGILNCTVLDKSKDFTMVQYEAMANDGRLIRGVITQVIEETE